MHPCMPSVSRNAQYGRDVPCASAYSRSHVNFCVLDPGVAREIYTLIEVLDHPFRRRTKVLHG